MADNSEDHGKSGGKKIGIKFLLSNSLAGSLIGTGGKSIKELIAITEARVIVSGSSDTYPGTTDRVILVQGTKDAVSLAQTLIWEMIGLMTKARENREEGEDKSKVTEWNPRTAFEALGSDQSNDDVEVSAKFTIPAAAGGAVLGRGGESIRSMGESSGANIAMSGKDEALFTQERVVSISGTVSQCIQCTDLVLQKLWDQSEAMMFANRGTTYASPLTTTLGMLGLETRGPRGGGRGGRRGRGDGGRPRSSEGEESAAEKAAKSGAIEQAVGDTTITLSVPDELIGNIFGRNGSTLREIIALSHARVVVSPRGEYVDNTTNRLVTITGSPTAAQTAHLFITQRLHTPSNPPPRNSGRKPSSK